MDPCTGTVDRKSLGVTGQITDDSAGLLDSVLAERSAQNVDSRGDRARGERWRSPSIVIALATLVVGAAGVLVAWRPWQNTSHVANGDIEVARRYVSNPPLDTAAQHR